MRRGNLGEHAAHAGVGPWEAAGAERAVSNDSDAVLAAVGQDGVLDGAFLKVVEDLVAGAAAFASDSDDLGELVLVELGDAPRGDRSHGDQLLEGGNGVCHGMSAWPVQEIAVEALDAEALHAPLARGDRAAPRGVRGQLLADEEDVVAAAADGFADELLDLAVAIHLGRVDVVHAEVEATLKEGGRGRAHRVVDRTRGPTV